MIDDIFDDAEKGSDAFEDMAERKPTGSFKQKRENYWDKRDIQPANIDVEKFNRSGKSFAVYVFPENDVPDEAADKIFAVAKGLMEKGFIFRHTGNKDNALQNRICAIEGAIVKSFLPWKKFNTNVEDPVLSTPMGYRIAIGIHKKFMQLPAAVRAILARDVNALVGPEATDQVDLVLAWTDGGNEALTKNTDFKKVGNNVFILQVAKRANLPVVNVYNSNFIDKLKEIIK